MDDGHRPPKKWNYSLFRDKLLVVHALGKKIAAPGPLNDKYAITVMSTRLAFLAL